MKQQLPTSKYYQVKLGVNSFSESDLLSPCIQQSNDDNIVCTCFPLVSFIKHRPFSARAALFTCCLLLFLNERNGCACVCG